MNTRQQCSHETLTSTVTVIRWCIRCSGWRYFCWQESLEEPSDTLFKWSEVTSGFWEVECLDPYDAAGVLSRILRAAQEIEQDAQRT